MFAMPERSVGETGPDAGIPNRTLPGSVASLASAAMGTVRVAGETDVVECGADETILAALHRAGRAVRAGCRRGGCGICKIDVVAGTVEHTRPVAERVLPAHERDRGTCLPCRAVPVDEVTVSLRQEDLRAANAVYALYLQVVGQTP